MPLTTIQDPAGGDFGHSLAVSADTLVVASTGWDSESRPVYVYDRSLAPSWGLRATLAVPAGQPDGWGGTVALNGGDLLAVGAQLETRIHQRDFGGAGAWGLRSTVPKYASASALRGIAFSGDRLAVVQQIGGQRRVSVHDRNAPIADAWSSRATLTNPLPDTGAVPFGASISLEGDLLVVTGLDADVGGIVIHAYRKDQNGTDLWGRVGTLRPANIPGVTFLIGAPALSGGRLICTAVRPALTTNKSLLVVSPPAALGGGWTLENTIVPTGALLVDQSFANNIRRGGADSFVVDVERTHSLIPGAKQRRVIIYRGTGAGLIAEREVDAGPPEIPGVGGLPEYQLSLAAGEGTFAARTRVPDAGTTENSVPSAVSVHERNAGGTNIWGRTVAITRPPAVPGYFGGSVAISGLLMAVGDPEDSYGGANAGAVRLYQRSQILGRDWKQVAVIRMVTPVAGARFGSDVDVSETGIVVATAPGVDQVAAMRTSGIFATMIRPAGINAAEGFGQAVAITPSGADIFVGATRAFAQGSATIRSGAVAHFRAVNPASPASYTHLETLRGNLSMEGSLLGWSLDAVEDTLVAGAWLAKGPSGSTEGRVWTWARTAPTVTYTAQSTVASPDQSRGFFGHDVALGYDRGALRLVVGTTPPLFSTNTGGAFAFSLNGSNLWIPFANLLPTTPQSGYGLSVAYSDGVAVVGSPSGLNGSATGGVEIFYRESFTPLSHRQIVVPMRGASGEGCGTAVAFDTSGLAAGAPLGDRVYTWRFGGYERWLGKWNVPGASHDPLADPDSDARTNLREYAGGGDPLQSTSGDEAAFVQFVLSGYVLVMYWEPPAYAGLSYEVGDIRVSLERSTNGIQWFLIPSGTLSLDLSTVAPGSRELYRFRVEYPFFH